MDSAPPAQHHVGGAGLDHHHGRCVTPGSPPPQRRLELQPGTGRRAGPRAAPPTARCSALPAVDVGLGEDDAVQTELLGSIPVRSSTALTAVAASSSTGTARRLPPNVPTGVRTGATIAALRMVAGASGRGRGHGPVFRSVTGRGPRRPPPRAPPCARGERSRSSVPAAGPGSARQPRTPYGSRSRPRQPGPGRPGRSAWTRCGCPCFRPAPPSTTWPSRPWVGRSRGRRPDTGPRRARSRRRRPHLLVDVPPGRD